MSWGAKRVLFIEPVFPHYRHDTYSFLLNSNQFESLLLAGTHYENIKESDLPGVQKNKYIRINLGFATFYYLRKTLHFIRKYKPDAIVCSGVDLRHIHTIIAFVWAKLSGIKFLWWSHAGLGNQGKIGQWVRSLFYKNSDGVLAYSYRGKENLIAMGMPEGKIKVIGNALNAIDYGFDSAKNCQPGKAILLFSGRITPGKKLDILIKALKVLNNNGIGFTCWVVGGGDVELYRKLSKSLGLTDHVEFFGPTYGNELKTYFSQSTLFVYPGGIGLSMVQALSYGIPVITTDAFGEHGPEIELLNPGVTGELFRDGDSEDLAKKIVVWIKRVVADGEKIATDCRNRVKEFGYLPEVVSSKIIDFITLHLK